MSTRPADPERTQVRLRFSKLGKVRFTSHRDTARIWERALRRAELPVAYTEGFSPRPRLSFGLALSTGHESLGEYLDVDLDLTSTADARPRRRSPTRLDPALPAGFAVQGAAVVEPGTPSLQEAVTSCSWRIEVTGADPGVVGAAVEQLLDADQLVVTRERKGRDVTEDLRPALLELALPGPPRPAPSSSPSSPPSPAPCAPASVLAAARATRPARRRARPGVPDPPMDRRRRRSPRAPAEPSWARRLVARRHRRTGAARPRRAS